MRIIVILLLMVFKICAQNIQFPLKASPNKKYVVDQTGEPVFLNGFVSWRLIYALPFNQAKQYLVDRKAKGFNAIMIHILPDAQFVENGTTSLSYSPNSFFDYDISKPNEQYFAYMGSILNLCNEMNMAVFVAPLYLGCCHDALVCSPIRNLKNSPINSPHMEPFLAPALFQNSPGSNL